MAKLHPAAQRRLRGSPTTQRSGAFTTKQDRERRRKAVVEYEFQDAPSFQEAHEKLSSLEPIDPITIFRSSLEIELYGHLGAFLRKVFYWPDHTPKSCTVIRGLDDNLVIGGWLTSDEHFAFILKSDGSFGRKVHPSQPLKQVPIHKAESLLAIIFKQIDKERTGSQNK